MDEARVNERMAQDLAMLRRPDDWPNPMVIHLKTQPWVAERKFGYAHRAMLDTVFVKSMTAGTRTNEILHYSSLEELVKTWSVD